MLEIILADFKHGTPWPHSLSRHAISHGAEVNYDNEENSLKTILILDFISDRFQYVSIGKSKVYHRFGCKRIGKSTKDHVFYHDARYAEKSGRKSCKVCFKKKDVN